MMFSHRCEMYEAVIGLVLRVLAALFAPANRRTPRMLSSLVSLLPTVICFRQPLFLSTFGFEEEHLFPHCYGVSLHSHDSPTPSSLATLAPFTPGICRSYTRKECICASVSWAHSCQCLQGKRVPMGSYLSMLSGWCTRGRCMVR
jgi:hypothetical protein